ncbi:MAG: Ferric reductase domain protein transmembrane component domain-containing protein [candidate division WWE3 bacterium GW2011_GWF2_41_45]|uniref:FAD-binding FR-type domain-containing protein n=3 Tax=Katanobacteria TaxID=422282 RepID=A0A1F4W0F6_UNCKA|nr:MAG: Ferric reductase domain protein transmembrane component domain-containing protein [candidate division WWE3 bacterium GW2011_GWC2_41_23]KKS10421.1 MAG: Ferric reductase domain protein transmembrane component domain-containing protein [candidate division WWE3 bacterium GW2011_GWF2_41_45]KKS12049.1 MAG: Ferric reductase domain protein transmembrane component domain-containing protein [candidate division WWE3 bacterium GW2011_GWF1_41_53]KKS20071.1 MAG: Ferric reductase domain protein transme
MNLKHKGNILIILILLITVALFMLAKEPGDLITTNPLLLFSQFLAIIGTALFSMSFVLSSRARSVEHLFDGLGNAYKVHHFIGTTGFLFLINHPALLVLKAFFNDSSTTLYLIPGDLRSYNYGIFAIYLLILLIVLTLFIKLPYNIWKFTHTFMGAVLLFALLHVLNIESDVSGNTLLGLWMKFLLIAGGAAFIYKQFLYKKVSGKYIYRVSGLSTEGEVVNLSLSPEEKSVNIRPGQYAFIKVLDNKNVTKEEHPFSIVEVNDAGEVIFSIKKLGDYTRTLGNLNKGDTVEIVGPFGAVYKKLNTDSDLVFIAGGIGVTPFVEAVERALEAGKNVSLYYSVHEQPEALYNDRFKKLSEKHSAFNYKVWLSNTRGKISVATIESDLKSLSHKFFLICGPKPMMDGLKSQLKSKGVKPGSIYTEDFDLR